MGWLADVEYAIAKAVCYCRGIDPNSTAAPEFVRYAYRDTGNSPQPARSKDVVYITISTTGDPGLADYVQSGNKITVTKTTPMEVMLTYYGPNAVEYAEEARTRLSIDTGYGCPIDIFRKACLTLAYPIQVPVYAPEIEDGNWRKRCDLRFNLTLMQINEYSTSAVTVPPEITLES